MQLTSSPRFVGPCALLACALLLSACLRAVGDGTSKPPSGRPRSAGSSAPQGDASVAGNAGDGGGGHGGSSQGQAGSSSGAGRGGTDDDDAGSSMATPDSGSTSAPESTTCSLEVNTRTAKSNGTYAPANVGALWIETGSGAFVKTLALWADRRIEHLHGWIDASTAAGQPESTVDAITSATANLAGPHTAHWDCNDTRGKRMPDGDYQLCFEVTESNKAGPLGCVVFSKSTNQAQLMPPDTTTFKQTTIVFRP